MPYHPSGILVDIVGINASDKGRSCEEHANCGSVLKIDTLVRFRSVQIWCNGEEETALAVYWVTDGIDRCRVGFLPCHLLKHKTAYNGKLAQIVEFVADADSPADRAKSHRCSELFWLRQSQRKMKKMVPQVLMLMTTMKWMLMTTMKWMTRKENKIKKITKPTILPQKQALL